MNLRVLVLCFTILANVAITLADEGSDFRRLSTVELAKPVWDSDLVDKINSQQSSWTAGFNKKFAGWTKADAQKLLGFKMDPAHLSGNDFPVNTYAQPNLPKNFDSRTRWPGCVHPVLDQADCGSCWAFGSSESLSDRFCVQSNYSINVALSPQPLISCDYWIEFGCNGGILQTAWWWIESYGLVSLQCWPYQSAGGNVPSCRTTCMDGSPWKTYKTKNVQTHIGQEAIMTAIYNGGPVEASFMVFADFMSYTSGVYVRTSDSYEGGHAISIVGWGVDDKSNLPYWLVKNSWGTDWGENGFFKILRGSNECFIESDVVAGDAVF